jgi:hypothetical protein
VIIADMRSSMVAAEMCGGHRLRFDFDFRLISAR